MHVSLQQRSTALLLIALLLTLLIYLPGLNGGYVYDDMVFIVDNLSLHVSSTDWGAWVGAADSFPATHQGRWLGMLSFAGNHFLHGLDPWGYKLTNLLIHLGNGCLVWLCLRALFALYREVYAEQASALQRHELAAAMLAALWLLLPINLTGVLYVFQRVESLSNTFVFLGLWAYLRLRLLDWRGVDCSPRLIGAVLGATAVGLLVKESAVLLPLYVACVELTITSGKRSDGRWSRAVVGTFVLCFLLPLLLGLVWLLSWVGGERTYVRAFGTFERLLTQARVLMQYMHWTLLPNLSDLTLYHDDIEVSRGLLQPWTTLPSVLMVLLLPLFALWKRRSLPLMSLGILWFFAGHSLTATVIPLMLAFEHRNYFPSLGLLLALASVVGLEQTWLRPRMQALVFALLFLFLGVTTHLRALEWSNPLRLAASEAAKRPDSADAQYAYARALMRASGGDLQAASIDQALALLEARRSMPGAGITFDQGILILKARRGTAIDPALWQSMVDTLTREPPSSSDISAMSAIYNCMNAAACPRQFAELRRMLEAALAHPQADAHVYSLYGQVVFRDSNDLALALRAFDDALRLAPGDLRIRYSRIATLIEAGDLSRARDEIEQMATEGVTGSTDRYVLPLRQLLSKALAQPAIPAPEDADAPVAPPEAQPAGG